MTISWDSSERMAAEARKLQWPGPLKLKVGGSDALSCVRAVRSVSASPLRIDANASLSVEQAEMLLPQLAALGVELIEQPLAVENRRELGRLHALRPRPLLFVDESVQSLRDIEEHSGLVDGVVIKLAKAGGLGPALRQQRRARQLGLSVMLSCMVESSVAVTAAAQLAGEADFVDLDGPLLLASEPWLGVTYSGARLSLPSGPGLGLRRGG